MAPRPKSLRTLIGAGLVGLCAAPILAVGLYAGVSAGNHARGQAAENLLELSAQIASKLDIGMHERWRDIALITSMVNARGDVDWSAEFRRQLDALRQSVPVYAWIGAADTEGRVQVSTGGMLEGADVSARPWYRAGRQAAFAGDVHEAVLLAQKLPPNPNGEPLRFVDIAMPMVRGDGVPMGVLGAHLSWNWIDEVTAAVLDRSGGRAPGTEAMVVSRDGTVLMGPKGLQGEKLDLAGVRAGAQGIARTDVERWPDGKEYFTAVAPTRGEGDYRGLGWIVMVRRDAETVLSPAADLQQRILLVALAAAAAACALGWHLSGRVTRPLRTIAEAADRIGHGDTAAGVPPTRAFGEALTLSVALVRIAATLEQQQPSASPTLRRASHPAEPAVSAPREPAAP